jgi:hypothetical protein
MAFCDMSYDAILAFEWVCVKRKFKRVAPDAFVRGGFMYQAAQERISDLPDLFLLAGARFASLDGRIVRPHTFRLPHWLHHWVRVSCLPE